MSAVHICIDKQSEPLFYRGKRFCVSERWGPFQADKHGDPVAVQPSGRMLQGAYEQWKQQRTQTETGVQDE